MKRWTIVACALVAVLAWAGVAQAGAKRQVSLNFYRATVSQAKYQKMLAKDVDIAAATTTREEGHAADGADARARFAPSAARA